MTGREFNLHNFGDEIDDEPLAEMMEQRRKIIDQAGSLALEKVVDEDENDKYNFFTNVYETWGVGFSD
jgi:hypothetical protein